MTPTFSVAIPCYNRPDYLAQAIESCLRQSTADLEVIVSDDCSDADLSSVVASFRDPRIRLLRAEHRLGAVRNHQRAASMARGSYVICLNSDDLLLSRCLVMAAEALAERPGADAVYFAPALLEGNRVLGALDIPALPFANRDVLRANSWLEKFSGSSPSCCLFRRNAFVRLGGYRTTLRFAHDFDMYMRFMYHGGGVVFLPTVLSVYRRHSGQSATKVSGSLNGLRDILDLWSEPEYVHWTAADIADLTLANVSLAVRHGGSVSTVINEVTRRRLLLRIAGGLPASAYRRLRRWMKMPDTQAKGRYLVPVNHMSAVAEAQALIDSMASDSRRWA